MSTERFEVVTMTASVQRAERACQALEDAEIPVLLQHLLDNPEPTEIGSSFQILVPMERSQLASSIVKAIIDLGN